MRTLKDRNASGKFLILVGIDFAEDGPSVLQSAADLASTTPEAELHLVHAFGPTIPANDLRWFPELSDFASIEDSDTAAVALHHLATSIPLVGERVCAYVHEGSATSVITHVAEEIDADLVVVGSHGYREDRRFFGSVGQRLARTAPCPVLIIRHKSNASADPIALPCPACEASSRLTWGARVRCLDHEEDQHADTCGGASFHDALA